MSGRYGGLGGIGDGLQGRRRTSSSKITFVCRQEIPLPAEPWFLDVAFLAPHQPLDTLPGSEDPFAKIADSERRKCAAMLPLLDGSVSRILRRTAAAWSLAIWPRPIPP